MAAMTGRDWSLESGKNSGVPFEFGNRNSPCMYHFLGSVVIGPDCGPFHMLLRKLSEGVALPVPEYIATWAYQQLISCNTVAVNIHLLLPYEHGGTKLRPQAAASGQKTA